ncbi:MAG: formate dehydrogenase accessory protein FdhE [Methanocellales archaeon]
MAKQSIEQRIKAIEEAKEKNPWLEKLLEFYKAILLAQREIDSQSGKGTKMNLGDKSKIQELQRRASETRKPIISFLESEIFQEDVLIMSFQQISNKLPNAAKEELKDFLEALKAKKVSVVEIVTAVVKEDPVVFEKLGKEYKVNPKTLLFIASSIIQPFLEEIARQLDQAFLEQWWEAQCPVCGKKPTVARIKNRKRYLVCSLCGAVYLADLFLCVHCNNLDPDTLGFLAIENEPWFRIDYCEKCKHYLKVINDDKIKTPIPNGLEDVLTLNLDKIAKDAGLLS